MKRFFSITVLIALAFKALAFGSSDGAITNHWTCNPHQFEHSMTIVGVVQVDGEEQRSSYLEIGAFCGSECRGNTIMQYVPAMDRYFAFLTVYGADADTISFQLYDHYDEYELDKRAPLFSFVADSICGNPGEPYVFDFISYFTITTQASPSYAGEVIGGGDYPSGCWCTLTATSSPYFLFENWTKDGNIVGDESVISFIVTENATYVANFSYAFNHDENNIVYVKPTGCGLNDGSSWENATDNLNLVLEYAGLQTNKPVVWAAAGIYYGDTTAVSAFTMIDGVNVYGGFAGNESADYDLSLRDLETNATILDGQNARRVLVQSSEFNTETTWDGFTIRNGRTPSAGPQPANCGGGALIRNGNLRHCRLENNYSATDGGGIYAYSSAKIRDCEVVNNYASVYGGGIYVVINNPVVISNCLVANNNAYSGGSGICSWYNSTSMNVINTTIVKNAGVAVYSSNGTSYYRNCIVWGNGTSLSGYVNCVYSAIKGGASGEGNINLASDNDGTGTLNYVRFFDPTNNNFQLRNNSVCVDAGDPDYSPSDTLDLAGNPRVNNDRIDIGCYEFNRVTIETNISDEICQGNDYLLNGFAIIDPEAGESQHSITLISSQNIDSIVNLTLTVFPVYSVEENANICEGSSYYWRGNTYTESGIYYDTLQTIHGCDSIISLTLTVYPVYSFSENANLCEGSSYNWHGNTFTESGIYYDSLQSIHGCDSIFQLSLELFNTPLGEFAAMTPTNNYPFTSLPIRFTWDAVSGAEYYKLYLWNANDPTPETPVSGHITSRSYYVSSLPNHQTYQWYVEAVNTCFTTESSVRTFTLNIPPTMSVNKSNLSFGEVVLNNSATLSLYVSGNALNEAITLQIMGEDASMFSVAQGSNWNEMTGGSLSVTFNPTIVQYNFNADLVITSGTVSRTVHLSGSLADMFVFNTYVTQDVFEMNSTVPIYGTVMDVNNNPMAGAEVEVKVKVMGTTRSLFATTGDDGHFSVDFVPAISESGYYTINSGRVGHNNTAVHDDFNIPGMNLVTNGWILWDVVQNETTTGSIVIRNRSQIPLTNIQVTATNLPEGCSFTFQPLSLQGMEEGVLEYSVTGSVATTGYNYQEVRLVATSDEGATMNFSVWYYCSEPRGVLYASPRSINTTMTKGISKIVDVLLYNNGTGPTGSVYIDLPSEEWLSVVGNDTLPSIAVHDSAYFSLRLSANQNTPLVQYTGNIAVNCERGDGLLLPYTITAVSDSTGTLVVDVTDDYTYNGNGEHLAGATVTVKGYYSLETVAMGLTGSDGLFTVSAIPEGYYRMSITAPHHASYQATILIEGGQTNMQDIYLQYQAITYSWTVVPTEIEDEYTFELVVEYETNVPRPVVVIDMPQNFPTLGEGESYVFDYVITNYGLIDSYGATLYPPTGHPLYDFSALVTEIDTLHAQSTVVIPCTMTRRAVQRPQAVLDALGEVLNREDECPDRAMTEVQGYYYCRGEKKYYTAYCMRNVGSHPCETPPGQEEIYEPNPPVHIGGGGGGEVYHYNVYGGGSTPIITTQNDDCNEDSCLTDIKDDIDSCENNTDETIPNLPPKNPANNR